METSERARPRRSSPARFQRLADSVNAGYASGSINGVPGVASDLAQMASMSDTIGTRFREESPGLLAAIDGIAAQTQQDAPELATRVNQARDDERRNSVQPVRILDPKGGSKG